MDGQIGVLVREHVAKEVKLEQGHAAFKDNATRNLKKIHIATLVNVVSFKAMTILK